MASKNLDNPWLKYPLFTIIPLYSAAAGWIFGPIIYPAPFPKVGETTIDVYSNGNLTRSLVMAGALFVAGLVVASLVWLQLNRQADEEAAYKEEHPDTWEYPQGV